MPALSQLAVAVQDEEEMLKELNDAVLARCHEPRVGVRKGTTRPDRTRFHLLRLACCACCSTSAPFAARSLLARCSACCLLRSLPACLPVPLKTYSGFHRGYPLQGVRWRHSYYTSMTLRNTPPRPAPC